MAIKVLLRMKDGAAAAVTLSACVHGSKPESGMNDEERKRFLEVWMGGALTWGLHQLMPGSSVERAEIVPDAADAPPAETPKSGKRKGA